MSADGQCVDETRAAGADVKGGCVLQLEQFLDDTGGGGELHIAGAGGHDDQIDIPGGHSGHFHRFTGGGGAKVRRRLVIGGDMALFDAGPAKNPVVLWRYRVRQHRVGQYFFRQVGADAGDADAGAFMLADANQASCLV